jgi:hypothetical protein
MGRGGESWVPLINDALFGLATIAVSSERSRLAREVLGKWKAIARHYSGLV